MASTLNPIRYPASFFKMVSQANTGELNITIPNLSRSKANSRRTQWNAFRAALKHQSEKLGNPAYKDIYADSLAIRTKLSKNPDDTYTLAFYVSKADDWLEDFVVVSETNPTPHPHPVSPQTDIATIMGMPSNAELESIRELRSKYKADIIKAIRLKFIPGICPMPADCPAPEDDPIAAFEYLAEQGIYLSDTAKAAHFELVSQREK